MTAPTPIQTIAGANKYETRAGLIKAVREAMQAHGNDCDLNHFDVSGVTDFRSIFQHLPFRGDISRWDVSNATSMMRMFEGSAFDGDISAWDVSKVTTMQEMFGQSQFNGDISRWDVSAVTNMTEMFAAAQFTGDVSAWDVQNVGSFTRIFHGSDFAGDISKWRVRKDALMVDALNTDRMVLMAPSVFHWRMADADPDVLTPTQRAHWDSLVPIAHGMGFTKEDTAFWLQGQWLEKSAPDLVYALPELELG